MDILGSLGIDFKALLAQIINFLLLLFILKKFLYGPVVQMLDKRKKTIAEGLENAEKAKAMIEKTERETQEKINLAVQEADKVINEAKAQAKKEAEKIILSANETSTMMLEKTKKQIELEKEKIIADAKKDLSGLVMSAVEKIVESSPSKDDVERAISKINE